MIKILSRVDDNFKTTGDNDVTSYKPDYSVYNSWKQQLLTAESENKNGILQNKVEELQKENSCLNNIIANLVIDLRLSLKNQKT